MYHNTKNKGKTMFVDLNDDAGKDGNNIIDNECDVVQKGSGDATQNLEKHQSTFLDKGIDQLTNAQAIGLKFSSLDDGGEFYNTYVKLVGFSIRKDEIKHNKNNIVTSRRWVCAKKKKKIANKKKLCKVKFHARGKTNNKKWLQGRFLYQV